MYPRVTAHNTRPLGLGVVPVWLVLDQVDGLVVCPRMEIGLGEAAPPDFILKAPAPVGMPRRQGDQPIAPLFFVRSADQDS